MLITLFCTIICIQIPGFILWNTVTEAGERTKTGDLLSARTWHIWTKGTKNRENFPC